MSENQESVTYNAERNRYEVTLQGQIISGTYFVSDEGHFTTEQGWNVNPAVRNLLFLNIELSFGIDPEHKERVDKIFSSITTQALAEAARRACIPT